MAGEKKPTDQTARVKQEEFKVVDEEKFAGIQDKPPLEKVNALLDSALNADQATLFESLRADIQGLNFDQQRSADTVIMTNCRNLLFIVYSIYNTEKRRVDSLNNAQSYKDVLSQIEALSPQEKAQNQAQVEKLTEHLQNQIDFSQQLAKNFEYALNKEFSYYLELLSKIEGFERFEVNDIMIKIHQDIKGDDIYAQAMRRAHQQVTTDLAYWRMKTRDLISIETILQNSI
jgi:hypothetical protein